MKWPAPPCGAGLPSKNANSAKYWRQGSLLLKLPGSTGRFKRGHSKDHKGAFTKLLNGKGPVPPYVSPDLIFSAITASTSLANWPRCSASFANICRFALSVASLLIRAQSSASVRSFSNFSRRSFMPTDYDTDQRGESSKVNTGPRFNISKSTTPPERNMIARRRWFSCRALKIPRRDSVCTRRVKIQR
jgi:hypothetical protein